MWKEAEASWDEAGTKHGEWGDRADGWTIESVGPLIEYDPCGARELGHGLVIDLI